MNRIDQRKLAAAARHLIQPTDGTTINALADELIVTLDSLDRSEAACAAMREFLNVEYQWEQFRADSLRKPKSATGENLRLLAEHAEDAGQKFLAERQTDREEIERLRSILTLAKDALYNGFEPDNQSATWHRIDDALKESA